MCILVMTPFVGAVAEASSESDVLSLGGKQVSRVSDRAFSTAAGLALPSASWDRAPIDIPGIGQHHLDASSQPLNDLFTGSAVYSYSLQVPVGVNGLEPAVALSYSSLSRTAPSVLGSGWSLSVPSITRDTKATRSDEEDDMFLLHLPEGTVRLVEDDGVYHTEQETFFHITRDDGGWVVKRKDGTTLYFGGRARLDSILEPYTSVWYLSSMEDTYGNSITYEYDHNPGRDIAAYLSAIRYGLSEIRFSYDHASSNTFDGFVGGTRLATSALLRRIDTVQNGDLVLAYTFDYDSIGSKKVLSAITEIGSDNVTALPPVTFTYYNETGWEIDDQWAVPSGIVLGDNDTGIRFYDANDDGLVDLARMRASDRMSYWMNQNNGWGEEATVSMPLLSGFADSDNTDYGVRFLDLNADGRLDLWQSVKTRTGTVNLVLSKEGGAWVEETLSLPEGVSFVEKAVKCDPAFCSDWRVDEGISCNLESCQRTCAVHSCSATGRVIKSGFADSPEWDDDDYKEHDSGDYVYPTSANKCYTFEFIGSDETDSYDQSECYDLTTDDIYEDGDYDDDSDGKDLDAYAGVGFIGTKDSASWLASVSSLSEYHELPAPYPEQAFYNGAGITSKQWKHKYFVGVKKDSSPDDSGSDAGDWDGFNWPLCEESSSIACAPTYEACANWGLDLCGIGCVGEGTAPYAIMGVYRSIENDVWDALLDNEPEDEDVVTDNSYFGHSQYNVTEYEPTIGYEYMTCTSAETWSKDTGVRLVDLNGDGKTDLLQATPSTQKAWLRTEDGWQESLEFRPPALSVFVDHAGRDKGVRIEDVNGDGLPDLVKGDAAAHATWLNNGNGWQEDAARVIPGDAAFLLKQKHTGSLFVDVDSDGLPDIVKANGEENQFWRNTGRGWIVADQSIIPESLNNLNSSTVLVDVNGDGAQDIVVAGADRKETSLSRSGTSLLLHTITNNLGGVTTVQYSPSSWFMNTGADSISDLSFPLWVVTSVAQDNGISGAHHTSFATSYSYANGMFDAESREFRGFGTVVEQRPDASTVYHSFHQDKNRKGLEYTTDILDTTGDLVQRNEQTWIDGENDGYAVIELASVKQTQYGSGGSRVIETDMEYDDYGNPEEITHEGDASMDEDDWSEMMSYVYNLDTWMVNARNYHSVYDADDGLISEQWLSYDGKEYGEEPDYGGVTHARQWNSNGDDVDVFMAYDEAGNLRNITDDAGNVTSYQYDPSNRFVAVEQNPLGHTTQFTHDQRHGVITEKRDPNEVVSSYSYDSFGRPIQDVLVYDSLEKPTTSWQYSMNGDAPSSITVEKREVSGTNAVFTTTEWYDGFGNVVQQQEEAGDGQERVINWHYDWAGRVQKQDHPVFIGEVEGYAEPALAAYGTSYEYDVLGRALRQINADGASRALSYDGARMAVTDENGNIMEYSLDGHGRIISVVEHNEGEAYTTTYRYDPLGNTLTITDNEGNEVRMEYDSLGRRVSLEDQDVGLWEYNYDGNDNLLWQSDALGNEKTMSYDALDRVVSEKAGDRVFRYEYDHRKKGILSSVSTPSAMIVYVYDERLRPITKAISFRDGTSLSVDYEYDTMDRLVVKSDPQGDTDFRYGNNSRIEQVPGVLRHVSYHPSGGVLRREYMNGVTVEFDYDPLTLRLQRMHGTVQDVGYGYDLVGNVLSMVDNQRSITRTMAYDDLNRLVHADALSADPLYSYDYTYDYGGNMLSVTSPEQVVWYDYESDGHPLHAPGGVVVG